ncbi:MAG: HAMP domain-containing protein, partial [Lachnospiraceae bacterium]|nr:HAMP domain-containing protein [Lachnospiraceae bacterium]
MEFKKKLITVALILFLLPLIMAGVSVYLIGNYQSVKTQSEYGEESGIFQILANPVKILDWLTSSSYKEIHEYIKNEPYKLEKQETLDEINSNMNSTYSYLVVRKNDEYVYIGDEEKFEKIDVDLPAFINNVGGESSIVYLGGSFPCLVRQLNFLYSDMGKGSAFIVININELVPQLKLFAVEIIVICFLIITITAIVLVCWLYKSVLEPINKLSKATRRISFGDLDFEIEVEKDDQIGTIFNDFELM